MVKIRKGNDIDIQWTIVNSTGEAYSLEGLDTALYLTSPSNTVALSHTVSGNVVSATYYGADQKTCGKFIIKLVVNEGTTGMRTIDEVEAFQLVPYSYLADSGNTFTTESVEFTSILNVGIQGPRGPEGKSIYDLAVERGYTGTEDEFYQEYADAVSDAQSAATSANSAAGAANSAAESANSAASSANSAASAANSAASSASSAATAANTATRSANTAAESANSAATSATSASSSANSAARAANSAAEAANSAASNLNEFKAELIQRTAYWGGVLPSEI